MNAQLISWAVGLVVGLLAVLTYIAAGAAGRIIQMAAALDALNTEVARTAALVGQVIAAQANAVPAADVQAAADGLKATNDTLQAALPPVP